MKLERITDAMTDKTTCALFVDNGPIYLSVEGPASVSIWPNSDEVHFSPLGKHFVRVGAGSPHELTYGGKRHLLAVSDPAVSKAIIKALATGDPVKVRYVDFPSGENQDVTVNAPAFAYVWGVAMKQCSWPTLGVPAELPPVKLSVYEPTKEGDEGYAQVSVPTNKDLGLAKNFDKFGGGCHISLGVHEIVGMHAGTWTTRTVDLSGIQALTVKDQSGAVVFEGKFPKSYGMKSTEGTEWDLGEKAARAMWSAAPNGTISITEGTYPLENIPLYGFRELWKWGMDRCSFPALE